MIWSIIVGGLIGWLAGKLMNSKGGLLRNILLGIVGSGVGNWLAGAIGLVARNSLGSFLIGLGGACVVILVCRWLFKEPYSKMTRRCSKCIGVFSVIFAAQENFCVGVFPLGPRGVRPLHMLAALLPVDSQRHRQFAIKLFLRPAQVPFVQLTALAAMLLRPLPPPAGVFDHGGHTAAVVGGDH